MKQAAGIVKELGGMCRTALAVGACVAAPAAFAQDAAPAQAELAPATVASGAAAGEPPLRLELSAAQLPRFEPSDAAGTGPRLDLTLLPPRSSVGLALGMGNLPTAQPQGSPAFAAANRPTLDVGVTVRHTLDNSRQIDVTAWRRMTPEPDAYTLIQQQQPRYMARVEMNLKPASKTGLVAERGFLGVQLGGGAKLSLKRKDGRPMLYYRTSF